MKDFKILNVQTPSPPTLSQVPIYKLVSQFQNVFLSKQFYKVCFMIDEIPNSQILNKEFGFYD